MIAVRSWVETIRINEKKTAKIVSLDSIAKEIEERKESRVSGQDLRTALAVFYLEFYI